MFLDTHQILVAKPTISSRSEGALLIRTIDDLSNIRTQDYIFEKFIKGAEYRYLLLNHAVIGVQKKIYDGVIKDPENVRSISLQKSVWETNLVSVAIKATEAMHLSFAAVDFLIDEQGNAYILEINSAPSIWPFHYPNQGPALNVARMLLEATIKDINRKEV